MTQIIRMLTLADRCLAYQQVPASDTARKSPGVMFLSGFGSDMSGNKASFLSDWCTERQFGFLRFDYRGCGQSPGKFEDGTIGCWLEDSLAMLDHVATGPQILVGSSMGGWLALLLAKYRPDRIAAIVGLAAAPDFTQDLVWDVLTPEQKSEVQEKGVLFDHGLPITLNLLREGQNHLVLNQANPLVLNCSLHLIQGQKDEEVPWTYTFKIARSVTGADVRISFIHEASHRLSRPEDLDVVKKILENLINNTLS